jgi:hypothetical protein
MEKGKGREKREREGRKRRQRERKKGEERVGEEREVEEREGEERKGEEREGKEREGEERKGGRERRGWNRRVGVLLVFEGIEGAEHQKRAVPGAFVVFKGRARGRGGGANIRHVEHAHMGLFYMS